jgi:hypothetical protein
MDNIHLTAHNSYKMTLQLPYWVTEGQHRVVLMDIWSSFNTSNSIAAWDVNITHEDKALRELKSLSIDSPKRAAAKTMAPDVPRLDILSDLPPFMVPQILLPFTRSMRDLCDICSSSKDTAYAICDRAFFNLPFVFGANTIFGKTLPSPTSQFCYWSGLETFLQKLIFKLRALYDNMHLFGIRLDDPERQLRFHLCPNFHDHRAPQEPSTCYWMHSDFKSSYTKWIQAVLTQLYELRRAFPEGSRFVSLAQEFTTQFHDANTLNRTLTTIVNNHHSEFLSHITRLKDFFTLTSEWNAIVKEKTSIVDCVGKLVSGEQEGEIESRDGKCAMAQVGSDARLRFVLPLGNDVNGWEW